MAGGCGVDSSGSGYVPVMVCCEHAFVSIFGFIKRREFLG
jgi:hypothetical protein